MKTISANVSLERAISKLGAASRKQAHEWIKDGQIAVDGRIVRDPLLRVDMDRQRVFRQGRMLRPAAFCALLLSKPKGVITSSSDGKDRPTVFSLLPQACRNLHAVGRLDMASSGLLILTNNTRLSSWLTDPANGVARVYAVTVRGLFGPDTLRRMEEGVREKGELLHVHHALLRKASRRESHLTVTLCTGKNREIRRLMLALGHEVTALRRVSFGGLKLGELEPGQFRELSRDEIRRAFPGIPL
jgi:23S rRNA pseudouridine2605 synthase